MAKAIDNSRQFVKPKVIIGGVAQKPEQYTALSVTRSMGGAKVDQALIRVELSVYLDNASARPKEIEQTVEIISGGKPVFFGVIEDATYTYGDTADTKILVGTIQPWHFGVPITQAQYLVIRDRNGRLGDVEEKKKLDEPIVFNGWPNAREEWINRDSKAFVGNKTLGRHYTALTRDNKNTDGRTALLIPLDAVQTDVGRERYSNTFVPFARLNDDGLVAGSAPAGGFEWTLRDAVRYVCVLGNSEAYFRNPTDAEYELLPQLVLPRTELPVGKYLPDYLDMLLTPYGFDWYVEPDGRKIAFTKWGEGVEVDAKYAKVGSDADYKTTNLLAVENVYSISQTINEIHVIGGLPLVEGTFELKKVGRDKWVLNEGADYDHTTYQQYHTAAETQQGVADSEVTKPQPEDLFPSTLFGTFGTTRFVQRVQRRRRFFPTITSIGVTGTFSADSPSFIDTRPIGPNNGYDIEILDLGQSESSPNEQLTWINIDELDDPMWRHLRVLEDECGVFFDRGHIADGEDPNEEAVNLFLEALGLARLRITAAIEADFAVQAVVERRRNNNAPSSAANKHTWVWRDPDRWPCRQRIVSGTYATKYAEEVYSAETPSADAIVADMTKQARAILDRLDCAKISGAIVFNTLDNQVPIGGIVKKIAGREWHLATRHSTDAPKFPQVVAVNLDFENALIVATLSSEPANSLEAFA